jgi:paraquat-inducible protein A
MTIHRHFWMALLYGFAAALPAVQTIQHTDTEARYTRDSSAVNNFQNNGAVKEAQFWKDLEGKHHVLGPLIKNIFEPSLNRQFHIPPEKEAQAALDTIPGLIQLGKDESATAFFWSCLLLLVSLVYLSFAILMREKAGPEPLFALTLISLVSLTIGVLAPAMVIMISPATPTFPHFVLYYKIRSVLGVILELYQSSYWVVGVCLTVFSILIPLGKVGLTLFVLEHGGLATKRKISKFLHAISKWSMADVFVAAILLSNFAARANHSTQAYLYPGFYYFMGYCLLSLLTTMLLERKFERVPKTIKRRRGHHPKATR